MLGVSPSCSVKFCTLERGMVMTRPYAWCSRFGFVIQRLVRLRTLACRAGESVRFVADARFTSLDLCIADYGRAISRSIAYWSDGLSNLYSSFVAFSCILESFIAPLSPATHFQTGNVENRLRSLPSAVFTRQGRPAVFIYTDIKRAPSARGADGAWIVCEYARVSRV